MNIVLPELGEGIDSATVVAVKVKPGDTVTAGQDLFDVETDKASVPVASTGAGTVGEIRVKPGDKVAVGGVLLTFSGNGEAKPAPAPVAKPAAPPSNGRQPSVAAVEAAPPAKPTEGSRPPLGKIEFKLPNLGEGIDSATVVSVKVKAGDAISAGQELIEVETDKCPSAA